MVNAKLLRPPDPGYNVVKTKQKNHFIKICFLKN